MKKEQVKKVLAQIRPQIQLDGGDIELAGLDVKRGIVKIKFKGACVGCPLADVTLETVISETLSRKVKGFKAVEVVEDL